MWENEGLVQRYIDNPIILPNSENDWESKLVYNCAAVLLDSTVFLIYRAMGEDHIARFGLASSEDGINFERFSYPIFYPKAEYERPHSSTLERDRERGGVEDPRATIINDYLYLVYTAFHRSCQVALAKISIKDFIKMFNSSKENKSVDLSEKWNNSWERIGLAFPTLFKRSNYFSRNAVLMELSNDLFLLFYRINKGDILFSLSTHPEGPWEGKRFSFFSKKFGWERERIGISTPPINIKIDGEEKTLFFYHGVESKKINDDEWRIYHLGAFFFTVALEGDKLILKVERLIKPILDPLRGYETSSNWLSPYHVQAVFCCGAVSFTKDELFVYYSAGDSSICVGKVKIEKLLREKVTVEIKEVILPKELFHT